MIGSFLRHLRKLVALYIPLVYGIVFISLVTTSLASFIAIRAIVPDSSVSSLMMLSLSHLAVIPGLFIPSWLPLFRFERDGELDGPLRLRWFRQFTNNGERIRKLMASISPDTITRLNRSSVASKKAEYLFGERFHWGVLLAMLPAFIWAAIVRDYGFILVFSIIEVAGNIWPIFLLRRLRARVERIESHSRHARPAATRT